MILIKIKFYNKIFKKMKELSEDFAELRRKQEEDLAHAAKLLEKWKKMDI